jgi:hypothetical protein
VLRASTQSNRVRKLCGDTGTVITLAGSGQARHGDGFGVYAHFQRPVGLAVDHAGTVFVADTGNHRIRQIESNGVVRTLAGCGVPSDADGGLLECGLRSPCGIVAGPGYLLVADHGNHKIKGITLLHPTPIPLPEAEPDTDVESVNSLENWYTVYQAAELAEEVLHEPLDDDDDA